MGFPLKQPTRARLIRRLEHEPVRNVHLEHGHIEFDYDDTHIEDRVVLKPCVPMVGSWSRKTNTVYVDRKVPPKERVPLAVHEAIEKHNAEVYGLDPFFDAHLAASGPEAHVATRMGINLADYNMEMEGIFRANLRRKKGNIRYHPGCIR